MKKIFAILSFFASFASSAQESFEGTIKYAARALKEKDTIQIQIDFAPKAIKVLISEPGREHKNKDYLLIDFDSGKVYTINHHFKTYTSHKLVERMPSTEVPQIKTIAGYNALGEIYNEEGVNHIFGSMLSNRTIFYTAEKLSYKLPEKFQGNFELMMIQKNKIVLGAEIHFAPRLRLMGIMNEEEDSAGKVSVFIEAKEIIAKQFGENDFRIPEGFEKHRPYSHPPDAYMDSLRRVDSTMYMDSAISAPQVDFADTTAYINEKAAIKKSPAKKPARKKTTTKQNAIRRKDG